MSGCFPTEYTLLWQALQLFLAQEDFFLEIKLCYPDISLQIQRSQKVL